MSRDDDWDDEDYDDLPDGAESEVRACPYCGEDVYEDAERCPHCDRYLSKETSGASPKPWWVIVGVIVCLYIVYRWITP